MNETHNDHAGDYTIAEAREVGSLPGTLVAPEGSPPPSIVAYLYDADHFEAISVDRVEVLPGLRQTGRNLWLDVNGLGDPEVIAGIGTCFDIHRLSLEDAVHLNQRPKVDDYDGYLFAVAQYPLQGESAPFEQISLVIGPDFLVTFQAYETNRLDKILQRLRNKTTRVRRAGSDYLAYAILDLIVDAYFPLLEVYDQRLEEIEAGIKEDPSNAEVEELFAIKRSLARVRRHMWGTRDAMTFLTHEEHPVIQADHQFYFRDVQDHAVRIIEFSDTSRDTCIALTDFHLAQQGQRMNEVMKVLTIIATLFIPLTFIAGIYGMNFDPEASPLNMPELGWHFGYPAVWIVMVVCALLMITWFRRLGWLGGARPQQASRGEDKES